MVTISRSIAVLLCLVYVPHLTAAYFRRSGFTKRYGGVIGSRHSRIPKSKLTFRDNGFQDRKEGVKYSSLVLECQVSGTPNPTINWLKDGERIVQGPRHSINDDEAIYEDHSQDALRISQTNSRLYIDCLTDGDEGIYTCVAETPTYKKSQSTKVSVEKGDKILYSEIKSCSGKRSGKGEPARIYMWSVSRLEVEGTKIQLFCRAQGFPKPVITWFDVNNEPVQENDQYKIARNGDLIINDISWFNNMGGYTCVAENALGSDSTLAFVYPTAKESSFSL